MSDTATATATATAPPAPPAESKDTASAETNKANTTTTIILLVFFGIWIIFSIWAIIKSLLCTGKSGSTGEKILGVVIAFFMGPFYFLYLYANKNYCMDDVMQMPAAAAATTAFGGNKRKHK